MANKTERAWAAGFFDGEGCIRHQSTMGNRIVSINIAQTNIEPLERFLACVDAGKIYGPYRHKNKPHHKPYWVFTSHKIGDIRKIFKALRPYLSSIKLNKFIEVFSKYDAWIDGRKLRPSRQPRSEETKRKISESNKRTKNAQAKNPPLGH